MHHPSAPTARRVLSTLALTLFAAACNRGDAAARWEGTVDTLVNGAVLVKSPAAGLWEQGQEWKIEEEARIGSADEEGPELFGQISALEVDPLGRVWVLDGQAQELRVFGPDAAHVRTIGRKGRGPGEFEGAAGMLWAPDGRLWVADFDNGRYSVFDTAGAFVTSHLRRLGGYTMPWRGGFDSQGRFYEVNTIWEKDGTWPAAIRFDSAMAPDDTMPLPDYASREYRLSREGMTTVADVPFTPIMVRYLADDGHMWSGVSDRYRIHRHRLGGDTLRVVEKPYEPLPVTAAERDSVLKQLSWFEKQGGRLDASQIPGTKPAFTGMFTDDEGNLWVRPVVTAEDELRVFDIFDREGRYLGRLRAPFAVHREPVFRAGVMYAVTRDEMDVPYVVRARIVKPG